jgi:hypothetical protein
MMRQKGQFESVLITYVWNDSKGAVPPATAAPHWSETLVIFGCEIAEGLGVHIPRSFEGIVQVGQHEMSEEEQKGCDGDGDKPNSQIVERKEKKKEQNGGGGDDHEEEKSAGDTLGAEGKAFIAVGAGLIRDLQQMLMRARFRLIRRLDPDDARNDVGEKLVGAFSILAVGQYAPFRFRDRSGIRTDSTHDRVTRGFFQSIAEEDQVFERQILAGFHFRLRRTVPR